MPVPLGEQAGDFVISLPGVSWRAGLAEVRSIGFIAIGEVPFQAEDPWADRPGVVERDHGGDPQFRCGGDQAACEAHPVVHVDEIGPLRGKKVRDQLFGDRISKLAPVMRPCREPAISEDSNRGRSVFGQRGGIR